MPCGCFPLGGLKCPGPEQEVDDVAFVRLQPVQLNRRHRTKIEPIDVHGIDQLAAESLIAGDGAADERWPDRRNHLFLRTLDHGREGKHVFLVRDRRFRRRAVHDRGQQELRAPFLDDAG